MVKMSTLSQVLVSVVWLSTVAFGLPLAESAEGFSFCFPESVLHVLAHTIQLNVSNWKQEAKGSDWGESKKQQTFKNDTDIDLVNCEFIDLKRCERTVMLQHTTTELTSHITILFLAAVLPLFIRSLGFNVMAAVFLFRVRRFAQSFVFQPSFWCKSK